MQFRFGDLLSGAGGMGYGAMQSKLRREEETVSLSLQWAVDFDSDSCQTYRNNISPRFPTKVLCQDVRNLDFSALPAIDALTFGCPFHDLSNEEVQFDRDGRINPLYTYAVKALEQLRPIWFLCENVAEVKSTDEGVSFDLILKEMCNAGYDLAVHRYRFEEYGIPQARHRIFVVGIQKSYNLLFRIPERTTARLSCQQAIEIPPIHSDAANHEFSKSKIHGSHLIPRLIPQAPAPVIKGVQGNEDIFYHWKENRLLTNREKARLQTFPDDFIFYGRKQSVRRQLAIATPPMGAKLIIEAILKTFSGVKYEYEEPNIGYFFSMN